MRKLILGTIMIVSFSIILGCSPKNTENNRITQKKSEAVVINGWGVY